MADLHKILSLFFILFVLNAGQAKACRRAGTVTVKEAVAASDIVFKGTVIAQERTINLSEYGVATTGDTSTLG